jgi:hypothetical protein
VDTGKETISVLSGNVTIKSMSQHNFKIKVDDLTITWVLKQTVLTLCPYNSVQSTRVI